MDRRCRQRKRQNFSSKKGRPQGQPFILLVYDF